MLLFFNLERIWYWQTRALLFLSFSGFIFFFFLLCCPISSAKVAMVIGYYCFVYLFVCFSLCRGCSCCFASVLVWHVYWQPAVGVLLVSGWHTQLNHLRTFCHFVPHFVSQLSTLPSFSVISSTLSPIFPVSCPLSSSVNLSISPPTRLCLARASVCEASVRLSVRCGRRMLLLREGWDGGSGKH